MNLMKWFRTHTKQIMVVTVLFAMLSFVGGSALVSILGPKQGSRPFAVAFGEEISEIDLHPFRRDIDLLSKLFIPWNFGRKEMATVHWYMLAEEARRAGIVVTDEEADDVLQAHSQFLQRQGARGDFVATLRARHGFSLSEIRRALQQQYAIEKNTQRLATASVPSEPQARRFAYLTGEKITIRLLALDAGKYLDPDEVIPEEELREQFESHQDIDPAESEDGFGYRYPRRVKIQYILAERPKIQSQIDISFEEVKTFWKANKAKYKKVEYLTPPAPTTQPSTQPAPKPKPQRVERQKTFSEARPDVERELRERHARQLSDQAMRKAAHELLKPWLDEQADPETGYKPTPPNVEDPNTMKAISDRVSAEFGITLEYVELPLQSEAELARAPGLQGLIAEGEGELTGTQDLTLAEYAFRVPPFFENTGEREIVPCLQVFQTPDAPLTRRQRGYEIVEGRLVAKPGGIDRHLLFRVVEARETEPPASLADVREEVERDCRLTRALTRIEPVAKELCAVAARVGLDAALDFFEEVQTKTGIKQASVPAPFARRVQLTGAAERDALLAGETTLVPPTVPGVGQSERFVNACFEMTEPQWSNPQVDLPETEQLRAATTRPALDPTPAVRWVFLPKQKMWFVVELVDLKAVAEDEYESSLRQAAYSALQRERSFVLREQWLDPDRIAERCGYRPLKQAQSPEDSDEDTQPAEPPDL